MFDEDENGFHKSYNEITFQNTFDECDFNASFENEVPLLEELEIYPDHIMEKSMAMLNPFQLHQTEIEQLFIDFDLPGPILIYLIFGVNLFLAGKSLIFDHIYVLSVTTTIGMYALLKLMNHGSDQRFITIGAVVSTFGYGMVNIVWLSMLGILMDLNTTNGFIFAITSILMATLGTSHHLCIISKQIENRSLIAFPIALIYILFSFLVVF